MVHRSRSRHLMGVSQIVVEWSDSKKRHETDIAKFTVWFVLWRVGRKRERGGCLGLVTQWVYRKLITLYGYKERPKCVIIKYIVWFVLGRKEENEGGLLGWMGSVTERVDDKLQWREIIVQRNKIVMSSSPLFDLFFGVGRKKEGELGAWVQSLVGCITNCRPVLPSKPSVLCHQVYCLTWSS